MGSGSLPGPRHRWLRPQRLPAGAEALLRGGPPLRHRCRTAVAGRRGRGRRIAGTGGDRALRDRPRRPDADDRMTSGNLVSVEVPDIGDFEDVPIIEILVSPGDEVALDDPLLTLESDKATMDVPTPFAGTVRDL